MEIIHGINQIKKFKKPVVTIGVFDGVHLGHRNILQAAVKKARSIRGTSVVLTFWPHPQKEENIYSLEHRLRLIDELGIDVCIVANFNHNFAKIEAVDFIENILFKKIGVYYIYVGKNFTFGKNAKGDVKALQELSKKYNFKLKIFDVIKVNNKPISSTYIRNLIKKGNLNTAQRLLVHPVSILGTVIKGDFLGRKIGFPTANINPHHEVIPPNGVYAVRIVFNDRKLKGVCYIGTKPTFKLETAKTHIEVYIFNFEKSIYGKYLEIQFIKKIRDEKKFASSFTLTEQIHKDIRTVQHLNSCH